MKIKQAIPFLPAASLSLMLFAPVPAAAAALGEVLSISPMGQPLEVDIRLAGGEARAVLDCLRIAPAGTEPGHWVTRARLSSDPAGRYIRVSDSALVSEPVLRLALENVCDGRLRREFTLLMPFPDAAPVAAPAPRRPAASAERSAPTVVAPAPKPALDAAVGFETWTLAPGETLTTLAEALYPDDPTLQARFVAATARANPALFPDRAARDQLLPPGTEIRVPDPARFGVLAASRPATLPADTRRPPAPAAAHATEPVTATASTPPPATTMDRVVVQDAPPDDTSTTAAQAAPGYDPSADIETRERQLITAIDRSIQRQFDLVERIRELERLQAQLIEEAHALDVQVSSAVSEQEAESAGPSLPGELPQPEHSSAGNDLWLFVGLFALLAATLVGLQTLQRRQRESADAQLRHDQQRHASAAAAPEWPEHARSAGRLESARASAGEPASTGALPTQASRPQPEWGAPSIMPDALHAQISVAEEHIEEHESAVELADIMMSFGRVQGAAETLAEFIRSNPNQAVQPWLKLLSVYRAGGMRAEFDALARRLNKTFNVKAVTWDNYDEARLAVHRLEDIHHLMDELIRHWRTPRCQAFIESLLRDNRDGQREGFPLGVIDDLLTLAAVLEVQLGRPEDLGRSDAPDTAAANG